MNSIPPGCLPRVPITLETREEMSFWDACVIAMLRSGRLPIEAVDGADFMTAMRRAKTVTVSRSDPYR